MPEQPNITDEPVDVEEHVGVTRPDAFEQTTDDMRTTGRHIFADPNDGKEKEVVVLDPVAGASSEAPPNSGIPSAMTQHGVRHPAVEEDEEDPDDVTPMANRAEPMRQYLEP